MGTCFLYLRCMALVAAFCFSSSLAGLAHGPFDSSTHVTVGRERLEVSVILGSDVARQFFADYLPGLPLPQPVGRGSELPMHAATNLFSLSTPVAMLFPKELRVLTDGLEFTFVASYAKPDSSQLQFRASFFELNKRVASGVFEVRAEDGELVSTEILSRSTTVALIALAPRSNQPADSEIDLARPVSASNAPVMLTNPTRTESKASRKQVPFVSWIVLALVSLMAGGLFLGGRKQRH